MQEKMAGARKIEINNGAISATPREREWGGVQGEREGGGGVGREGRDRG